MARRMAVVKTEPAPAPRDRTPSVVAGEMLADIRENLASEARYAERALEPFVAQFAKNPARALAWSAPHFKNSARLQVCQDLINWFDLVKRGDDEYLVRTDERTLRIVAAELRREVNRNTRWPDRSTSPQSNDMSLCLAAERAEWSERLDRYVDRLDGKSADEVY